MFLFRPNFCCGCGEKIVRSDWKLFTSRRFCDVCANENKRHERLPQIIAAGGVLSIIFSIGVYFGGSKQPATMRSFAATPAEPTTPKKDLSAPVPPAEALKEPNTVPPTDPVARPLKTASLEPKANVEPVYYCGALTKKGTPCTRKVKIKGTRCWQHQGQPAAAEN